MVKWVWGDQLLISIQKSFISEVVTLEKLGCCINGKIDVFETI